MNVSVLDIFKRSGDAHIGQTLTRLAALAQAAHAYEMATRGLDVDFDVDTDGTAERPMVIDEQEAAR